MTKLEKYLKEVEARCEAATKGPWKVEHEMNVVGIDKPFFVHNLINESWEKTALLDAEFIAHSRTDVEVLLEMVKQYEKISYRMLIDISYKSQSNYLNYSEELKEIESLIARKRGKI